MEILKLVLGWAFVALVTLSLVAILAAGWQRDRERERLRALARADDGHDFDFAASVTPIATRALTPAPAVQARTGTR